VELGETSQVKLEEGQFRGCCEKSDDRGWEPRPRILIGNEVMCTEHV
jgi:hypothetical protein